MKRRFRIAPLIACLVGCAPPGTIEVGRAERAIIGGTVDTGDPAVVLVTSINFQTGRAGNCTGEVVSPHVVLTAGHCVHPGVVGAGNSYYIFTGKEPDFHAKSGVYEAAETHYEPGYNPTNQAKSSTPAAHDVAVIILKTPIPVTPLRFNHVPLGQDSVGKVARLVGYGVTDINDPQSTGVKYQTSAEISRIDATSVVFADPAHNTCEGDSGGPALLDLGDGEVIVGTVSVGDQDCALHGIDARIDKYASFIDETILKADPPPPPDLSTPAVALDASAVEDAMISHGGCSAVGEVGLGVWSVWFLFVAALTMLGRPIRRFAFRKSLR